jgi:hypothetical protein
MRSAPTWYARAAQLLAGGATQAEVAEAVGTTPKTLRRHLAAPGGLLRAQIEQAKVAQATQAQDELAPLRGKALAVLEKALDAGDVGAAKALLSKLVASPADAPPAEAEPEPEISVDDAYREVALSLPAAADLARLGGISPEVVQMLKAATRAFWEDDLQPRPDIDVSAERVEVTTGPELQQATTAGAAIIPIRG